VLFPFIIAESKVYIQHRPNDLEQNKENYRKKEKDENT
jgi:hypothetical protein